MKIIIIGGGNTGYYLAKSLIAGGHDVRMIEKNKQHCLFVADRLDVSVIHGDGTVISTLEKAGADHADILVAITGRDEDNFVSAQLGKKHFNIKKTIVKANNPKNIDVMKELSGDIVVSSINMITNLIEREVDAVSMRFITRMSLGNNAICEYIVQPDDHINNKKLMDIKFPKNSLVITVLRNNKNIIPKGDTVLVPGDDVMIMTDEKNKHNLFKLIGR